jgi:hypothetical protein
VLAVPEGSRVHPGRGLTLFVGPEGRALRVTLFAPCSLDDVPDRLSPQGEPLVERPLRGDEIGP